jgi:hypothetical protein
MATLCASGSGGWPDRSSGGGPKGRRRCFVSLIHQPPLHPALQVLAASQVLLYHIPRGGADHFGRGQRGQFFGRQPDVRAGVGVVVSLEENRVLPVIRNRNAPDGEGFQPPLRLVLSPSLLPLHGAGRDRCDSTEPLLFNAPVRCPPPESDEARRRGCAGAGFPPRPPLPRFRAVLSLR